MKSSLINERYLHAHETSFQVLKEPGKKATSNSFMWVYLNNDDKVMPNSKLGKTINYSLNQWSHLIKPFVIGRKNWLFANSVKGTKSSEILYSIVETAKLNKLDIYEYLRYVINHFEDLRDESKVYDYLPFSDKLPEKLKVRT